jgi:hypothetical protein
MQRLMRSPRLDDDERAEAVREAIHMVAESFELCFFADKVIAQSIAERIKHKQESAHRA